MRDKIIEVIDYFNEPNNEEIGILSFKSWEDYRNAFADKILEVVEKEQYVLPDQTEWNKRHGYIKASQIEICPECFGLKVIRKKVEPDVFSIVGEIMKECPTCKGKGWVSNND